MRFHRTDPGAYFSDGVAALRAAIPATIGELATSLRSFGLGWQQVGQIRVFHQETVPRSDVIDAVRQAVGLEPCLRNVRATIDDRDRPPAASLVSVRGVAHPGRRQTIDLIAIPKEP